MFEQPPVPPPPAGVPLLVRPEDLLGGESELEQVADIWSADARAARAAAELAVWVARLARRRRIDPTVPEFGPRGAAGPAADRRPPVLADVSETFVPELALIRGCTEGEAALLAQESLLLVGPLADTWAQLYAGRIDARRARVFTDLLGAVSAATAAAVQDRLLPGAAGWTTTQLRDRIYRLLARIDADALDARRKKKARSADVRVQAAGDGFSELLVDLPTPTAHACADAIDRYARLQAAGGDPRPIGMLRAAVAADLILRPWDERRPPVTAQLTVHAPLPALDPASGQPPACEVNGQVVTAAQCRDLLHSLDLLGLAAAPSGGSVQLAIHHPDGGLVAVATRRELRRAAHGTRTRRRRGRGRGFAAEAPGCPAGRGREIDTTTRGQVDPPTDRPPDRPGPARAPDRPSDSAGTADRDGPGLRPPPPTSRYRPTAAQRRFVRARDRRCRWPGCRRPPARHDLDHARPHAAGGPTACWNLCCLCRTHHRIKTFARGWTFTLLPDGRLRVTTPSGLTRTSSPPGWATDPEPDPPWLDETHPPDPLQT